jgi:acetoin utilization deacetylase AcuC-like enzyme
VSAEALVLRSDACVAHDPGPGHPERSARLLAVHDDLDARPIAGTLSREPRRATDAELARVHSRALIERVKATASREIDLLDSDTTTSRGSWEAARTAAGAVLDAVESTCSGASSGAFALVRPPGHHARPDAAMGFCLFNNVAVAAEHAVRELGCRRVLVLDPDVHHGNGTQEAFWRRRDVLYVSSHRWPFYPGTGAIDEIGEGDGEGFTVNLPLAGGLGDADLLAGYREIVEPIVSQWRPDLILVSAGFDTWHRDPLGGMRVTEAGFRALAALFVRWSREHCPGRIVFALEGGYALDGVVAGVRAGIEAMTGAGPRDEEVEGAPSWAARAMTSEARALLVDHWEALR